MAGQNSPVAPQPLFLGVYVVTPLPLTPSYP
jgi:hypothetical protein